jgi:FdhD protein
MAAEPTERPEQRPLPLGAATAGQTTAVYDAIRHTSSSGDSAEPVARQERVICEWPLVIEVNGTPYSLMRTPGHDRELVLGFLFTEALIRGLADVFVLAECPAEESRIRVTLAPGLGASAPRTLVMSSSCGLCGHTDIPGLLRSVEPVGGDIRIGAGLLDRVSTAMRERQPLFQATGGTHAAVLFDEAGAILAVREDVGRHNALDKLVGYSLLTCIATSRLGVLLSGRASLELIIKVARTGLPLVGSVSAPTAAAVEAARHLGITLCGFVRPGRVTVFAHPHRVH